MRVRIDKAEKDSWYESQVGSIVNVEHYGDGFYKMFVYQTGIVPDKIFILSGRDCTVLQETESEFEKNVKAYCPSFVGANWPVGTEHPKPAAPRQPFDLSLYQTGKYEVETRDGRKVRILATDLLGEQNLVVAHSREDGNEHVSTYPVYGRVYSDGTETEVDLFLIPKQVSKWVNVYESAPYEKEEDAKAFQAEYEDFTRMKFVGTKEIKTNE